MSDHLVTAYQSLPVSFERGDGCYLWDSDQRQYFDALCGIAVTSLGHNFPPLTAALGEQAATLLHTSNLYTIPWQQKLADRLCAAAGMERVFFGNSGAEANEAAIKLARLHGHARGIESPQIIVMQGAFHGRTMATLSATGSRKVQAGFEPLVGGFVRAPFDDVGAIEAIAANNRKVAAVLVEPVQGEAGIVIPEPGYLAALRRICDQRGWLLMLDEIQCGMARSGKLFAFEHEDIRPDVMTLAKALGNGVPIGACLVAGLATDLIRPGNHGSTFGGNPLVCRAALVVLEAMLESDLAANAAARGAELRAQLDAAFGDDERVTDIRQLGLLIGIELDRTCGDVVRLALERGLLVNVTAERVVRVLPPLILDAAQTAELGARLIDTINAFLDH